MSDLSNQQQNQSFVGILQVPGGITSTLKQVQDGDGNNTGLWLSSTNTNIMPYDAEEQVITATAGQTVFNLSISYTPATDSLQVFVNGLNKIVGVDYLETDTDTVTFLSGQSAGALVKFTTAAMVSNNAVDASNVAFVGVGGEHVNVQDLADPVGSDYIGFVQSGTGAVTRSVQDKAREWVSVLDFGAVGDGVADDTRAINTAIAQSILMKRKISFPAGTYLVTSTINIPIGTQLIGEKGDQYPAGFGVAPLSTTILFSPSVASDLFVPSGANYSGFRFHYSFEGFYFKAGNNNARYAFALNGVIYSRFENLSCEGFQSTFSCTGTINNRFVNVYCSGTVQAVIYNGSATTDVWEQCSFWGSPIGVKIYGANIGLRFHGCLFEQLDNYGMIVARESQNIIVLDGYSEDVPFTNNAAGAMFAVGTAGSANSGSVQLQIIGGHYAGRNAGLVGSFMTTDYIDSVLLTSVYAARFTNLFNTFGGTPAKSIRISGVDYLSITNFANDITKINGIFTPAALGSGNGERIRAQDVYAENLFVNDLPIATSGSWTPTLYFGGGNTGMTASVSAGKWTRVGNQVTANCLIILSAKGSSTGSATVTGLPVAANAASASTAPGLVAYQSMTALPQSTHYIDASSTTCYLRYLGATGIQALTDASFSNTSVINFQVTYLV